MNSAEGAVRCFCLLRTQTNMPRAMMARRANAPMTEPMMIGVVLVVLEFELLVLEEAGLPFTEAWGAAESVSVAESVGSGPPAATTSA